MKELISIIVPVYNVEAYLERCLDSLVGQTYSNIEIILVDDGSTDHCPEICDIWERKDPRIKVIHKENGGLSDARNAGLKMATGEYIAFVDSDDWLDLEYCDVMIKTMFENDADIVECGTYLVDESGEKISQRRASNPQLILDREEALERLLTEDGVYQTVWNKLYKRIVIQDIWFEVGKYHEDEFWTYKVFDRMNKMIVIHNPQYYYLQRDSSIMGEKYSIKRLDGLEARAERANFLDKYKKLGNLAKVQLWYALLYHYQNIICYLNGIEKKEAMDKIKYIMKQNPLTAGAKKTLSLKYRYWFELFIRFPYMTARIRNILGIGLK